MQNLKSTSPVEEQVMCTYFVHVAVVQYFKLFRPGPGLSGVALTSLAVTATSIDPSLKISAPPALKFNHSTTNKV